MSSSPLIPPIPRPNNEILETLIARSARLVPRSTKKTINLDPMISLAMSGQAVLRMFARFINANFILCPPHDEPSFVSSHLLAIVCSAAIFGYEKYTDTFVKTLEGLVYLNRLEMPFGLYGEARDMKKLVNVFNKITDFETRADAFLALVTETFVRFPKLERLTLTSATKLSFMDEIVARPVAFPCLETLQIETARSFSGRIKNITFAENCFPTVKRLIVNITEGSSCFSPSDIERVAQWLKSFTSLTTADIFIHKRVPYNHSSVRDSEITSVHSAFKSIDFAVPLQLTFKMTFASFSDQEENTTAKQYIEQKLPGFKRIPNSNPVMFVYKDKKPGTTFTHILENRASF